MNLEQRLKLYAGLSAPLPEEAVARSSAQETKRGYDTAGYRYQFVANRLNEVLGPGGWRIASRDFKVREVSSRDRTRYEVSCAVLLELGEFVEGAWEPWAQAWGDGGHVANAEPDARKGAFTNAFKKAAAFVGVGRHAYEGGLDEELPAEPQRNDQQRRQQQARAPAAPDPKELTHWRARLAGCQDKAALDELWAELLKAHPRQENPLGLVPDFRKRAGELQQQAKRRAG